MSTRLISALAIGAVLAGLPAIGSAAPPTPMQGCVRAFMQQLTAGAARPMKVVEGRESETGTPNLLGAPEYLLTARDAHSDRTIARVLCSTAQGRITLLEQPL